MAWLSKLREPSRPWPNGPHRFDDAQIVAMLSDPVQAMRHIRLITARDRMHAGLGGLDATGDYMRFSWTQPQQHLLALAPPQSHAGKTSSTMIPTVVGHPGPVVAATTKPDILQATAMARAQHGHVWIYALDGAPVPPGFRELHWSPIVGAEDWDTALETAASMTDTINTDDMKSGGHWRERADDLLPPVLHWAALTGASMEDVRDTIYRLNVPAGNTPLGVVLRRSLDAHGARAAAAMLDSVLCGAPEERANVTATAGRALKGYRTTSAMRTTVNPNFDPDDFVRMGVHGLRADTIYITASTKHQKLFAPLVVALIGQIRDAAFRYHRENPHMVPVVLALDEMFGLAPLPDLPLTLSQGGSQGVLIVGAVQDLTLIKSRWPKEADSFLTMFGHVLVYPGIRDVATLKAVSTLIGNWDKPKETYRPGFAGFFGHKDASPRVEHWTTERVPKFDPSEIAAGLVPGDRNVLLHFTPEKWGRTLATPYWRAPPWPQILTRYFEMALSGCVPDWVWLEAAYTGEQPPWPDVLPFLPAPDLTTWAYAGGTRPYDTTWAPRYIALMERGRPTAQRLALYERPARSGYGPNFAVEGSYSDRWWVAGFHSAQMGSCMSQGTWFEPQRWQLEASP
jgi:type IV secretion system protein VirD4